MLASSHPWRRIGASLRNHRRRETARAVVDVRPKSIASFGALIVTESFKRSRRDDVAFAKSFYLSFVFSFREGARAVTELPAVTQKAPCRVENSVLPGGTVLDLVHGER